MPTNIREVIVIGGGPAGITAAIYLKRALHDVLVLEKALPGGKTNYTAVINNYPGFENITGPDLAMSLYNHLNSLEIDYENADILSITKNGDIFEIKTDDETYLASTVIVATGTSEKKLGIPGEDKYYGRGVSYCAVCDGALYRGKDVALIGGGNSAFEEALYLSDMVKHLYLIHRSENFKASGQLIEKVRNRENITIMTDTVVKSIEGEQLINKIKISDVRNNNEKSLDISAVFPFIGLDPNTSFLQNFHILDSLAYVIVDSSMATKIEGLYACGDVVQKSLRQIVTAVSDGAIAATSVSLYLKRR